MTAEPNIEVDHCRPVAPPSSASVGSTLQKAPSRQPALPGLTPAEFVYNELALGQRRLRAIFDSSPLCTLKAGEIAGRAASWGEGIYRLRSGWACQFRDLPGGHRALVDFYLPGEVIGLDTMLQTRPLQNVLALTWVTAEAIPKEDALMQLMTDRPTALYLAWLLTDRQRRADDLLAALSALDARGRIATMLRDFYIRLQRRRLIARPIYNLPLTQLQIGHYLGLTVVHVNRVFRSLREDRIINFERHCLTILDLARLDTLSLNDNRKRNCLDASTIESLP